MLEHAAKVASRFAAQKFVVLISLALLIFGAIAGSILTAVSHPSPERSVTYTNMYREKALAILPGGGLRGLVSDKDLQDAFVVLKPHWRIAKTNYLLHALRLWGTSSKFNDTLNPYGNGTPSGERMLNVMLDSVEAESCQVGPYPFLYRSQFGVSVQYETGDGGIAHHDQYLKVMGELALPSATQIRLPDGSTATLGDVVQDSLLHFDIDQELEFTAVAYSRWLPPTRSWRNRHGEEFSFDDLSESLLRSPQTNSACGGTHTLYAMVNILRAHYKYNILSDHLTHKLEQRLIDVSQTLEKNQHASGTWLGKWYESNMPASNEEWGYQAITATGHHLEWIALAPEHLRPRREVIGRAAVALAKLIPKNDLITISNSYPPFSHAGRGLALLHEVAPSDILREEDFETIINEEIMR